MGTQLEHALRTPAAAAQRRESMPPVRIQRKCGCGGTCGPCANDEKKKKVQRRALGETSGDVPPAVDRVLRSPGRPLDAATRSSMESRFDRSFASVRVHTDAQAAASARAINASAYTAGTHIVFGAGQFDTGTKGGRKLLAHELAHVAQQASGAAIAPGIGLADDAHERAADRVADAVVAHGPAFMPAPPQARVMARVQRKGGSFCGFLANIFHFWNYSDSSLDEYLAILDKTNDIEDDFDSDDKARQVAKEWSEGSSHILLTERRKALLIREMLTGYFSGDDQKWIVNILERSAAAELDYIFDPAGGKISHDKLLSEFGSWKKELWRFYMRRYPDAYTGEIHKQITNPLGEGNVEPAPPDSKKLAGMQASERPVQFGDKLPESGRQYTMTTDRRINEITKEEAIAWTKESYGQYINRASDERAAKTKVDREAANTYEFEAFLYNCVSQRNESMRVRLGRSLKPEEMKDNEQKCRAEEPSVAAFYDRPSDTITIREDRKSPDTLLHEVIHSFADSATNSLGRYAMEGLTEFFTRRVILRHKLGKKEKPLFIGEHYNTAYDAIEELAIFVGGEELLARVHFQGALKELCTTLGKTKYDAWNEAMDIRDNEKAATAILRGPAPAPAPGKEKDVCQ